MLSSYLAYMPTGNVLCPSCHGGQSGELSFRLWRAHFDTRGKCFRASCGWFFNTASPAANDSAVAHAPELRPYTGAMHPLPAEEVAWCKKRYGFKPIDMYWDGVSRYVLPIWSPEGVRRGVVLRTPHTGTTLPVAAPGGAKAVTYREKDEPLMSWSPFLSANRGTVVLTEDQISALKVRALARVSAAALLGTQLTAEKVTELQRHAKRVVIALDPDATALAFKHARRWGQAFESCRVLVLQKDIKDADTGEWLTALAALAPLQRRTVA